MIFKRPAIRLSFVMVLLTVNLLFGADLLGFLPDANDSALDLRKSLSESLAMQFSFAAAAGEILTIQNTLRAVVERNDNIHSAAIRADDGKIIALVGEHLANWRAPANGKSSSTHVTVPIYKNSKNWGRMEIRFVPLLNNSLRSGFKNSFYALIIFVSLGGFLCYFFVLKRALRELDPAAVIPERVQKAFDVLQEGVLILDKDEQIVMANRSFSKFFRKSPKDMIGLKGSELGWLDYQSPEKVRQLPWFKVLRDEQENSENLLKLLDSKNRQIKLAVNASMVTDQKGQCHGALVTFDDISQLEENNFELSVLVEKLQIANDEIDTKNQELKTLANRDPLTLCLNRRALGVEFDRLFTKAKANQSPLSCFMVDIDFFKSVNDRYGHAVGDQVIKAVADVLKTATRDSDLVGRYGGEEFCVILPGIDSDMAATIAERIRQAIEKKSCSGVKVTASLGVASLESVTNNPEELIGLADKALYTAKNSGRNQVVIWGKDNDATIDMDSGIEYKHKDTQNEIMAVTEDDQLKLRKRIAQLEKMLKQRSLELKHYEMYDSKTGLPNHTLFKDRLKNEIARSKRKDDLVAVLSITIDTIRRIHETLGYSVAEELRKACGQRLIKVLRKDIDTVAMIENYQAKSSVSMINQTEFAILLADIKQVDHVTWVMKRMQDAFEKPFKINGSEVYTSVYFGVSICPHDGDTVDELCKNATNACSYAQKMNNKDRYLFFSQSLNEKAVTQLKVENCLHKAISNDELQLYYQPKIDAKTGLIAGLEALVRWQSDELGFVSPGMFIPIAEQSGQIDVIGKWVLNTACRQLRSWMDMGLAVLPVAVNVSGAELHQKNMTHRIQKCLDRFKIDPDLLEIELTETSLISQTESSLTTLEQLKDMGLKVTMDDFGTGYSSLSYLRKFPLACVKIDRSFVADINQDENANELIASIILIAHKMGLDVVAEGVEEKYQADHLIALGCEYLQGYYFSRPVPQDEATELLNKLPMAMAG